MLWMSIFLFLTPLEELSAMEIIQFSLTAAVMLLVGTGRFLFFRRQIVDIVWGETEDKLTFITYSGKRTEISPKEIKSVTKTDSRYVFHLTSGKSLSAYRYIICPRQENGRSHQGLIREWSLAENMALTFWQAKSNFVRAFSPGVKGMKEPPQCHRLRGFMIIRMEMSGWREKSIVCGKWE